MKTFICTYDDLWGRSDGRPTSTGRRSGSGLHVGPFQVPWKKCLFLTLRSYLEILIDARIKLAICYHTRPTDVYSGVKVTAHSQVSSSFIGNSALRDCRDLLYHIPYLHSGSDPFPLSLVRTIVVSTRITDPHYNRLSVAPIFTAGPYAVETSYCTYQRRSSIADHVHPLLQLANYGHQVTNTLLVQDALRRVLQ